ncbi:MAG TPA: RyR domain-containing protein [Pyrinomonadaceae bacterium]|nr:RyR domain-containing protein [Pyrinomonadaceae bacterium]
MATTDSNLPDVEEVSAKVHEAWMDAKRRAGVTTRKSESGEELMVPYEQLSEEAKDLDRSSVRAVYDAIRELRKE